MPARFSIVWLQCGRGRSAAEGLKMLGDVYLPAMKPHDDLLQCGRGRSAAEGTNSRSSPNLAEQASMWPRPISRGRMRELYDIKATLEASMWPRPISRGRTAWKN